MRPSSPRSEGFPRVWEHLVLKPRTVPKPGWSVRSPSLRASVVIVLCAAHDSGMSSQEADRPGDREAWQGLFLPGQLETTRSAAGGQAPREELGGPGRAGNPAGLELSLPPQGAGRCEPRARRAAVGTGPPPPAAQAPAGPLLPQGCTSSRRSPVSENGSPRLSPVVPRPGGRGLRTPWALGRQAGWHGAVTRPAWDTRALFR